MDIDEVLDASRAPGREALHIVEHDRLVAFQGRHGAVVTAPDSGNLIDIYFVRDTLFQIQLQQLMEQRPDDLRAAFDAANPRISKAADDVSFTDYALQSSLLNLSMTELSSNRLVGDLLAADRKGAAAQERHGARCHADRCADFDQERLGRT